MTDLSSLTLAEIIALRYALKAFKQVRLTNQTSGLAPHFHSLPADRKDQYAKVADAILAQIEQEMAG